MTKYIKIIITIVIFYFLAESIYTEMTKDKTPGKAKRLSCQKKVTSFERGFLNDDIAYFQRSIEEGNIAFSSSIEKAKYSKSTLFNYISLEEIDKSTQDILQSYVKYNNLNNKNYKLSYYIYENDKKDPGKKSAKSKLYAGYVVLEVKNMNNQSIYRVQIDFMDNQGADVKDTVGCAIKSLMTFNR